jgi:Ca2+-binding EF-hand superfamily protein
MKYTFMIAGVLGLSLATAATAAPSHHAHATASAQAGATSETKPRHAHGMQRRGAAQAHFPIDLSVMEERASALFDRVDTAGSGVITLEEFVAAELSRDDLAAPHMPGVRGRAMHGARVGQHRRQLRGGSEERRASAEQRQQWREAAEARRDAQRQALFEAADVDGDGQLSAEEFQRLPEVQRELARTRMFERLDANGDGVLDRGEFPAWWARLQAMDADGDGLVTFDEVREYRTQMRAQRGAYSHRRQQ